MVWAHNKINRTCKDEPKGERYKEGEGKADRKRDGKIIYENATGLGLGGAPQKAEDREEWRKVVVRSSLMPQRSLRLRDE